ncbi:MAG: hypothetical protein HUU21_27465, partial [Polyangiaceae bacterium]|nr:hypothetical protein [Polyangiaceae bacterium]
AGGGMGGAGGGMGGAGGGMGGMGGSGVCNDGDTMACYSGDPATNGVGECTPGVRTCVGGSFGPCVGEVLPKNETCDGLDNDCNAQTDELGTHTCGLGACQVTVDKCVNGMDQACVPLQPNAKDACDGKDDDCDGLVDEGCLCIDGMTQACYTGPAGTQGVGVCQAGSQTCANGQWGACMGDVTPSGEKCDGADNDCDGNTDEGLPSLSCGFGACHVTPPSCVNGQPQQCVPGMPSAEVCDAVDNDCDGSVDEGLPTDSCGIGECFVTVSTCANGQPNVCVPGAPVAEVCDGLDNDCNGVADNGNPGANQACSTGQAGVCNAGTTSCSNGALVCNQTLMPSAETCDGLDNNCNGFADEGSPGSGMACSTGQPGVCNAGTTTCANGSLQCSPTVIPGSEICNGKDDDCDGATDENNPGAGQPCSTGLPGKCSAGTTTCSNGVLTCNQTSVSSPETCNGIDDNCNGLVDENNPGGGGSCNTGKPGACSQGLNFCLNGTIQCVQSVNPAPQDICGNGIDDNCNGVTDENIDADGDGWGTCNNDCCDTAGPCSGSPQLVNPQAFEVLNDGIDNDCDPNTSDTVAPAACSTVALATPTDPIELVYAMDICNTTVQNPTLATRKWGAITYQLLAADGVSAAPQDIQRGVLANYGPNVLPKKGTTMAAISTGTARDQGDAGWVAPNGGWSGGNTGNAPPVYTAAHGGSFQTKPGCPAGSNPVYDSINLKVKIRVPTNAKSFSYKFKFYSAEYPEWLCDNYNDFYLALLTSTVAGIPADKNLSFDSQNNPVSVNNGFFTVCSGCPLGTSELNGTGMTTTDGGGTEWLLTTSPITPGEDMTIEFVIWDTGDHFYDSLTLLDDFKWDVNPATVGTIGGQ